MNTLKPVILSVRNLNKVYKGQYQALYNLDLDIYRGEIFALLGPNGAGKTTLINCICSIVNPTSGVISIDGLDIKKDYRKVRETIGLVPQEITNDAFEPVAETIRFSRGLFGKPKNNAYIESILKKLSLWDKKDSQILALSGGMKRRVMIAKALSHEPKILFLDEPTAGVDVNLRRDMWEQVRKLKEMGVTIILTTHYIEEAEEMADRIGVINKGRLVLIEEKNQLMKKLGRKELIIELKDKIENIPLSLSPWSLEHNVEKGQLIYKYDSNKEDNGISDLLLRLSEEGIAYKDIHTDQSSLEEIFIQLVSAS